MRGLALVLLGVALLASLPLAEADHCTSRIVVFGRPSPLPAPAPPYTPQTQGLCPLAVGIVDGHTLPPQTSQILVRVNGDFGPGLPSLFATVDGLGFEGQVFTLVRTPLPTGISVYQMREWVPLPDGTQLGELQVSVAYPSITASVTYRSIA